MGQKQGKEVQVQQQPANPDANKNRKHLRDLKKLSENYGTISPLVVSEVQKETNWEQVEVKKLYEVFSQVSKGRTLNRDEFKQGLRELENCGLKNVAGTPFADRLYDMLDTNKDGVLDFKEFCVGLSLLCRGTPEEKLILSFKAYDVDGSGYISKKELEEMFKCAWIAGFSSLRSSQQDQKVSTEELEEFAEEMAVLFAQSAFEKMDLNDDGELSFAEFKEFALQDPKITATLNGFKKEVSLIL